MYTFTIIQHVPIIVQLLYTHFLRSEENEVGLDSGQTAQFVGAPSDVNCLMLTVFLPGLKEGKVLIWERALLCAVYHFESIFTRGFTF